MRTLVAFVARLIPDRSNRTLWWLMVLAALAFSVLGPPAAAIVISRSFDMPVVPALVVIFAANMAGTAVIALLMLGVLRDPYPVRPGRALGFACLAAGIATIVRVALIGTLDFDSLPRLASFQAAIGVVYLGTITAAVIYGSTLERAIDASYTANARMHAALSHEEESVRAEVFDQLHGTLQAEFVAIRRILGELALRTTDPDTAATATGLEVRLESVYRRGVETVARALSPAGLDAGLIPAIRELDMRLVGAVTVDLQVDPIVLLLDDPTTGGLRREVRDAAYRIVEEAVSNAVRHSSANHLQINLSSTLRHGEPQLTLQVTNPRADRADVTYGQGLTRMRSRVTALGGDLRIHSTDAVFSVSARLPLQAVTTAR